MTGIEVEMKLVKFIKTHQIEELGGKTLAQLVNGEVCYNGQRALNSQKEDIVVAFASGLEGTIDTGVAMVNIYVPNTDFGEGVNQRDTARVFELSEALKAFRSSLPVGDFWFQSDSTIQDYPEPEIEQYYINLRLKISHNGN